MTSRYQLNLATRPFPSYRTTNVLLTAILGLMVAFSLWQVLGFLNYTERVAELRGTEQELRVDWDYLGGRVDELRGKLNRPDALAQMEEIRFLNQVVERKSFSWSRLLSVIEDVIPRGVYLTALEPQIDNRGRIRIKMEARGRSVADISTFIAGLEQTPVFKDVAVSVEERNLEDGLAEISVSMDAEYLPQEIPSFVGGQVKQFRRQKQQYLFGGVIGATGLVSLLFFLILFLPVRAEHLRLEASIERHRSETDLRGQELERLEGVNDQLETARTDRLRFLAGRFIPRQVGFAAMLPDLEELAQMAGIDRNRVQYSVDQSAQFGVYSVRINIPVRGDYGAVSRFIRALEDSETFFILDSIGLARSESGAPGELDLSLNLTTFFAYDG